MKKHVAVLSAALALGAMSGSALAAPAAPVAGHVAVCHLTGSATNPAVLINPNAAGLAGHRGEKTGVSNGRAATPHHDGDCTVSGGGGGGDYSM